MVIWTTSLGLLKDTEAWDATAEADVLEVQEGMTIKTKISAVKMKIVLNFMLLPL